MVLSCDGVSLLFSNLSFSQILKFAEDISVLLSDDKQKPNGALIRKHLCIPCRGALEPRSSFHRAKQLLLDLGSSCDRWHCVGVITEIVKLGLTDLATLE